MTMSPVSTGLHENNRINRKCYHHINGTGKLLVDQCITFHGLYCVVIQ